MIRRLRRVGARLHPVRWVLAALLVAGLQTAALAWMVLDRAAILRHGQRIELRPQPVDPRDLFRGDYVILTYEISRLPSGLYQKADDIRSAGGDQVWARIARDADAEPGEPLWRIVDLDAAAPETGRGRDVLALRGRLDGGARIAFGIERYYVPEGEGLALEALIGAEAGPDGTVPIAVEVAVDQGGRAAISALIVRGERVFEEPWY